MKGFAKGAAIGGISGAFVAGSAIALAGTGIGGVFNLGQENTVNAQTSLKGSVPSNAQLRVENGSNGVGLFGISSNGKGVYGKHTAATGGEPGIQGETASAAGAGVVGKNTGGGPGISAFVNPGKPPFAVNSNTRVANLNADQLDGKSSTAFLPSSGDIVLWYSPYDATTWLPEVTIGFDQGPFAEVYTDGSEDQLFDAVVMPLDQPQSVLGVTLKLKSVTICFEAAGAQIIGTKLVSGATGETTVVYQDDFVHSSPGPSCYDVAPPTPTVVAGSLYLDLDMQFYSDPFTAVNLYSVRVRLGT